MNKKINNQNFKLIIDKDAFDQTEVESKLTDYFDPYDYVVGDWSYGKLRLKGFCKKTNELLNKTNDYNNLDNYIKNNCAYGCKYFVLERIND
jgi:uncharacterized protein YutD